MPTNWKFILIFLILLAPIAGFTRELQCPDVSGHSFILNNPAIDQAMAQGQNRQKIDNFVIDAEPETYCLQNQKSPSSATVIEMHTIKGIKIPFVRYFLRSLKALPNGKLELEPEYFDESTFPVAYVVAPLCQDYCDEMIFNEDYNHVWQPPAQSVALSSFRDVFRDVLRDKGELELLPAFQEASQMTDQQLRKIIPRDGKPIFVTGESWLSTRPIFLMKRLKALGARKVVWNYMGISRWIMTPTRYGGKMELVTLSDFEKDLKAGYKAYFTGDAQELKDSMELTTHRPYLQADLLKWNGPFKEDPFYDDVYGYELYPQIKIPTRATPTLIAKSFLNENLLPKEKNQPLLLVGASLTDWRPLAIGAHLENRGYQNVRILTGGLTRWKRDAAK